MSSAELSRECYYALPSFILKYFAYISFNRRKVCKGLRQRHVKPKRLAFPKLLHTAFTHKTNYPKYLWQGSILNLGDTEMKEEKSLSLMVLEY